MKIGFPASLQIAPSGPLDAVVRVPGSKSLTNRALLCAALADGPSTLEGPLHSDDTDAMVVALRQLGVEVRESPAGIELEGCGGRFPSTETSIDARGSGTTARFLAAAAVLASGPVLIDGNRRMRERPISDLLEALRALEIRVEEMGQRGCPPVRIWGGGLRGGAIQIDASRSSQFVSALLLAAPCGATPLTLTLTGPVVSRPYLDLTLDTMAAFGAEGEWLGDEVLSVAASGYTGCRYAIEADASAASYPFAAAAIAGGRVRVPGVPAVSRQGDFAFLGVLESMGCRVDRNPDGVTVHAGRGLRGVEVDMNDLPDTVMTLAVVALFAEGTTRIHNVANLRIKESDRLAALERELPKLGASISTGADWIEIRPVAARSLRGAALDTYDDHRLAMAFALAGLRIPEVVVRDPRCVEKTWPRYFEDMGFLRATPA